MMKSLRFLLCMTISTSVLAEGSITKIPDVNLRALKNTIQKTDANQATTHLTQEQINLTPVLNLAELFKQSQSIVRLTNNSGDSSQTALSIRGFGDNAAANSLILVDGFPLVNPSLLSPNINAIALTDIARIDIVQGSEGVMWGDQAVGGVVNIITKHPEKWLALVNAGVGSYNKIFFNSLLGNKLISNGFYFKTAVFGMETDNFRAHNQQNNKSLLAQIGKDYARGSISLQYQFDEVSVNFPGGLTLQQFNFDPTLASNFVSFGHFQNQTYQILSKHELTENWLLETRLSHHYLIGDGMVTVPYTRSEDLSYFHPRLIGELFNTKITTGYEGQIAHYALDNSRATQRGNTQQNNFYAQIIVPIFKKMDLTLGARRAWQSNHIDSQNQMNDGINQLWVTEQGLTFRPNNTLQFFLRRSGNFRFPKANENGWTPNHALLQVQTGVSYEGGLTWHNDIASAQFSLYQLQLNNEIAFDPTQTATQPFGSFSNYPNTERRGASFVADYRLNAKLKLDTQINYVQAQFASGANRGKTIPAVPAWNANLGVNYDVFDKWQLRYVALYTGSRFASEDIANQGMRLPAYWLNSLALQYIYQSIYASFEMNNLFNQRYSTYTLYRSMTGTNIYYPGAGRNYLLTFKLNFS